jgi:hypothetical protein
VGWGASAGSIPCVCNIFFHHSLHNQIHGGNARNDRCIAAIPATIDSGNYCNEASNIKQVSHVLARKKQQ